MNLERDSVSAAVVVLLGILVAAWLVAAIVKYNELRQELRYINMEIGRTTGDERAYWKQKKRQLWLSLLPFYRR